MFDDALLERAERLLESCRQAGLQLATAESCTGGLIAGCLTAVAGSSDVVERGFVTYSNEAKMELLGVPEALIAAHGAVSAPVARAMAEGAIARSRAALSISVTGVAGPGGGSAEKPVGLVHIASAFSTHPTLDERHVFPGDRTAIRLAAIAATLGLLERRIA